VTPNPLGKLVRKVRGEPEQEPTVNRPPLDRSREELTRLSPKSVPSPAPLREELTRPAPMPTSTPISSGDEELTAEERADLELQWGHGLSAVDIEPYERENLQGSVCEGV